MKTLKVALRKTSLVDYPGKVAAVIFFQGCNLRCPWCYNWELVKGTPDDLVNLDEALAVIAKRRRILGGVVLSGGEPTLVRELPEILAEIKTLGLPVKLDTNGTLPDALRELIDNPKTRPDFIAMDIKLPPERYAELAPRNETAPAPDKKTTDTETADRIRASAALIRESGIPHEFRALDLPGGYLTPDDWDIMRRTAGGALKVRPFYGDNCLDESWNTHPRTK